MLSGSVGRQNLEKAINQINKTFAAVKRFKVGATKPGEPEVTAVNVTEIVPS